MRAAFLLLGVTACFHPVPPEGAACANLTDCPSPLVCVAGVCVKTAGDAGGIDADIDAPPDVAIDADLSCTCPAPDKLDCSGVVTGCDLGCEALSPGAKCVQIDPSNDVGVAAADTLTMPISIASGATTFDTETGEISGAFTRAAGPGVVADVAFELRTTGGLPLAVWSFHDLTVASGANVHFTGARSPVFVAGATVTITGTIDGSGGCYGADAACAGPGGGAGGNPAAATGCGPGGPGAAAGGGNGDGGGGGGGGATSGGAGGVGGNDGTAGTAGAACVTAEAEPLRGGSGGGAGSPGDAMPCKGGGGGGALQITAETAIDVSGTITMGGAGGEGGNVDLLGGNAGAGCGGGAGGAILLEAPAVTVSGILAANGGGGGGGATFGMGGGAGNPGGTNATPAGGGSSGSPNPGVSGHGGVGAAGTVAAGTGVSSNGNAGAGGGGAGAIYIRTLPGMLMQNGLATPAAGTGTLRTQ